MATPPLGLFGGPDPYKEELPNQSPTTQPTPSLPENTPQPDMRPEAFPPLQSSATFPSLSFNQGFTLLTAALRESQTHFALPLQASAPETSHAKSTINPTLPISTPPTSSSAKRRPKLTLALPSSLMTPAATPAVISITLYPTSVNANLINLLLTQDITYVRSCEEGLRVYNSECQKKVRGEAVDEALFASHQPSSTQQEGAVGTSGSYFIRQNSQKIAVFKPEDEEMGAGNCPNPGHRLTGARQRDGVPIGQGVIRECIAPLLGRELATIPPTVCLTLPNCDVFCNPLSQSQPQPASEKRGSLQQFMEGANLHNDMREFLAQLAASTAFQKQMRAMMIWDLLVNNTDRNRGNILVQGDALISIDHGCIVSEKFIDPFKAFWLESKDFDGLTHPLNSEELSTIKSLNWEERLQEIHLAFPHLGADTFNTLRASYLLLTEASEKGLSLKQIVRYFLTQNNFFPPTMHSIYNLAVASLETSFNESFKQELLRVFTEYSHIKQQERLSDKAIHQRINEELFYRTLE